MTLGDLAHFLSSAGCAAALACGNSLSPRVEQPPPPTTFAGTYTTRVTLTQDACGSIAIQDNPTTVTHNATSGAITLSHARITYSGEVRSDSTFTTTPREVDVGDGFSYAIAIAGRFRANGFDADATVDRSRQGGATCRFVVRWVATRQ